MPTIASHTTADVVAERHGAVLVLTLNRPARLNAWTDRLEARYFDLLTAADGDPTVRAIVVTGAGRGFCAGADMADLAELGPGGPVDHIAHRARPRWLPMTVRKPMVAAINGAAAGIGLVQALYCDVRFCVPDAKITTAFARRGLVAEYGMSWLLPRIVGHGRAMDLLLSARVVRGEQAAGMGLVDRLVDPEGLLEAAIGYATDLSENCSPWGMATIKAQVARDHERSLAEALADAHELAVESVVRSDVAEGAASFLERRPPVFAPLP